MAQQKLVTRTEMLEYIASNEAQGQDPVYWREMRRVMVESNFKRPDDTRYREWLGKQRAWDFAFLGTGVLDDEWAWNVTDYYVKKTRNHCTECYPVFFGVFGPIRRATPNVVADIRKGHLLLGFITEKMTGRHETGEPKMSVDEAFVLPCWNETEVEPILRGCFLY